LICSHRSSQFFSFSHCFRSECLRALCASRQVFTSQNVWHNDWTNFAKLFKLIKTKIKSSHIISYYLYLQYLRSLFTFAKLLRVNLFSNDFFLLINFIFEYFKLKFIKRYDVVWRFVVCAQNIVLTNKTRHITYTISNSFSTQISRNPLNPCALFSFTIFLKQIHSIRSKF